jgi:hypothetical protein
MRPCRPKAASKTSIAQSSSHAAALISPPTMRALRKYSSLWMTMRKASELRATAKDTERLTTTMMVLEIRLPITGSRPAMKVTAMSALANGRWTPSIGRTTTR